MKIGTGWMGWTEAQTLETSMQVIEAAYAGRLDMIRFMGGKPPPSPSSSAPPNVMTPELMMSIFGKPHG